MGPGHVFLINSKLSAGCWCYLHGVVLARTPTSSPLQKKEGALLPHAARGEQVQARYGGWSLSVLHRIPGRESAVSEINTSLAVVFQRNCTGSSARQRARAANREQKHHGKSCSLHCGVKFTLLLFLSQEDWAILRIFLRGFTIRKLLKTKLYFLWRGPCLQGLEAQHQHQDWGTTLCDHSPLGNTACMQSLILQTCNSHVQYSASPSRGANLHFVWVFII